ncbi:uncharacterized protein LOC132265751 [Phlebotomus argentipes]|uniref:uncharacterized protein LOC132265751 n=1 Tax=Phlebotomus argentipes TaxID=94469 RepID=UPI0028930E2B|nr:uncharacterized protein LOC132265751 [Phlebotomus argentipes]
MKVFLCFFTLFAAVALAQNSQQCKEMEERDCSGNSPVCCTYDDGTYRTFTNECEYIKYNCAHNLTCASLAGPNVTCDEVPIDCTEAVECPDLGPKAEVCCEYESSSWDFIYGCYDSLCDAKKAQCEGKKRCFHLTNGPC